MEWLLSSLEGACIATNTIIEAKFLNLRLALVSLGLSERSDISCKTLIRVLTLISANDLGANIFIVDLH